MGSEAFIPLKAGRTGPETARQAEIRLANLLKILRKRGTKAAREDTKVNNREVRADFRRIWLICPKPQFCYPDHNLDAEFRAISGEELR
jgi:hypothetical protein